MDEIDWIKNTKKALITFTILFVGFAIFLSILLILGSIIRNDWEYIETDLSVMLLIGIAPPFFLGLCYIVLLVIEKIMNSGKTVPNFEKEYIRDLPKHCSPVICSLIYDLKIDVYKDYTATILYLCINKYIELIKEGDTYKVKIGEQKDTSKLGRCEKYVLNIIEKGIKFDADIFKQEIIAEAQEKKLITNKKHSNIFKKIILILLAIIILISMYNINKIIFSVLLCIFGAVSYACVTVFQFKDDFKIVDTEYIRTSDGKDIALLLSGLKRYINEYTLIKDKEIDYIQILENYIPYALALGEADAVEEFIKYNEEYRDLIYNRKSMQ